MWRRIDNRRLLGGSTSGFVPVIFNAHFKSCAFTRDLTPSKLCVREGHWLGRYRFFREEKGPEGRGNCSPVATEAVQPPKEPRGKDIKKNRAPEGRCTPNRRYGHVVSGGPAGTPRVK
jgi:hypothetical protein